MNNRTRLAFLVVFSLSVLVFLNPILAQSLGLSERDSVADKRAQSTENITVVTAQNFLEVEVSDLVAFYPNGSRLYHSSQFDSYFDVDPVEGTKYNVTYVAGNNGAPTCSECTTNNIVETNLSTGETTILYSRVNDDDGDHRWHDVDRVSGNTFVVADLTQNSVFMVNTTTGRTEWVWYAQSYMNISEGGGFGRTWTHVNDVEVIEGGDTLMVSLRDNDRVVFINTTTRTVNKSRTLGSEDNYTILNEQHNPDYIPESRGGPAVVVADSENNRVVEYQWENGGWDESWAWDNTKWPRDADRLPNGNTLIADSNNDRIVEIDNTGEVIWSLDVALPYEVERFETGDESSGGQSAAKLDLQSVTDGNSGINEEPPMPFYEKGLLGALISAVRFASPLWFGPLEFLGLLGIIVLPITWIAAEILYGPIELNAPLQIER